jgi:hypothetical protein
MTESVSQENATSQVKATASNVYNFNLNVTGQLALAATEDEYATTTENVGEVTQTNQGTSESVSQENAVSQVKATASNVYNVSLNVTGQLALAATEDEYVTTTENLDEVTQTS